MGKIVANFFVSLDGVVEAPEKWHFPYFNDEMGTVIQRGTEACGAFLMGRVLYEEWSAYWPKHGQKDAPEGEPANDAEVFASFINDVPKYVVSNTLRNPGWSNTKVVSGDVDAVAAQLRRLKKSIDGELTMSGSATLVRWLLTNGLLDELALLVHPIVVGHGQRLFEDTATHPLNLKAHQALTTGVLHVTYTPA
jgi:dihydrofolate reductase